MLTIGMWRFCYALGISLHTVIKIIVKLKKKIDARLNNLLALPSS